MTRFVTPEMKVEEALSRFPQTLSVFVEYGFKPLRNPLLRRTFAPLVTIQGAARMHHFEPEKFDRFLDELNIQAARGKIEQGALQDEPEPLFDLKDVDGLRAQNIIVTPEVIEVDNRGLEPPEPMVRILAVVQQLAPGQRLEAINQRQPMLLYPKLEELGFQHRTDPLEDGCYRITITRPEEVTWPR